MAKWKSLRRRRVANSHKLVAAARRGSLDDVNELLAQAGEVAVDAKAFGFTPFAVPAINGHIRVMRALLEAGADPRQVFRMKMSSLEVFDSNLRLRHDDATVSAPLLAGLSGNREMLELLLEFGVSANDGLEGFTVLMAASATRSDEAVHLVDLLLRHGANVDSIDTYGCAALYYACQREDPDVARLLLERGTFVLRRDGVEGFSALHVACWSSACVGLVEVLLEFEANIEARDTGGWTPLMDATHSTGNHSLAIMGLLASRGADVNAQSNRGRTALWLATKEGHTKKIELLLRHGARPNDGARPPLHEACMGMHLDAAVLLLDAGADPNIIVEEETPLASLVGFESGSVDIVLRLMELLVANGADVNFKNSRGWTALHAACRRWINPEGDRRIISFLLQSGSEVNATDENDDTPLHVVLRWPHGGPQVEDAREAARLLLEGGADTGAVNALGLTPFVQTAAGGHGWEILGLGPIADERDREMLQFLHKHQTDSLPSYEDDLSEED